MEKMIFESEEAVKQSMNTGDTKKDSEVINAVLSGNIEIKKPETTQQQTITDTSNIQTVSEQSSTKEEIKSTNDEVQPTIEIDEIERQKKYNEFLEKKHQEEHNNYLLELKRREEELQKEKVAKEELEKKLRQLSELQNKQPSTSLDTASAISEEDEYASEYSKRTRQMVEELKNQVGDNPVVKELVEKIRNIESEYSTQKQERLKSKAEEERINKENKLYDNIRQFQLQYPDLRTKKDIKEVDQEYLNFRKDIAYLVKATSGNEVDSTIHDYFNNGEIRKIADSKGIKPVEEYEKYSIIADLIDLKNGIQRDPLTGKENPILDEEGKQVRYKSLDEVLKLSRYYNDITNARKQSFKEISKKLETIENAPKVLEPSETGSFNTGFTKEQEMEILNWNPREWTNDPEKRKIVEQVYLKNGLEIPHYRGRKLI
jgi:hypothetical protein